jgi:hypothetical protein
MGNSKTDRFLKRRMWREDGIYYFCTLCGDYKLETEFYNSKDTNFGKTYKCKLHYKKDQIKEEETNEYLRLSTLTDEDFAGAQRLLETLGYKFGADQLPVWKQFILKHKL